MSAETVDVPVVAPPRVKNPVRPGDGDERHGRRVRGGVVITTAPLTYTVDQTAAKVNVTYRCLTKWIANNRDETGQRSHILVMGERVPVVRTGSRWYVVAAPLDAALSAGAVAS